MASVDLEIIKYLKLDSVVIHSGNIKYRLCDLPYPTLKLKVKRNKNKKNKTYYFN